MALPFVVSRYLRPYLSKNDDGAMERLYDNGVTGRIERLGELEEAVLASLWHDTTAEAALADLLGARGHAPVKSALLELYRRAMIFDSHEGGEALLRKLRDAGCPEVPLVDQVELTNHCPMRCGFCPRGVPGRMQRAKGFMALSLFRRLLSELPAAQRDYRPIELHHLGESLLHPELVGFVQAASERGLPTELSVNPALLKPELCRQLFDAGIKRLVLSLDGLDGETLHRIRGSAARSDLAMQHIEALLDEVRRRGSAAPRIVLQMIAMSANAHQHDEFLRRFGDLGLAAVQAYLKPIDGPDPDAPCAAPASTAGAPLQFLCAYPFRSVVVLWDGCVVPCCRDDDARLVLGDLNRQSLREIWAAPQARELRRRHRTQDFPCGHLCEGCGWSPSAFVKNHPQRHPTSAAPLPLAW
jgi:MoaA/NifB/PqqE/SkfB family radical SAM enzyme